MWLVLLSLLMIHKTSYGLIYHLNATEYERMPPLFGLDEYEACLGQENGIYCVFKMDLFAEDGNELMNTIKEYSDASIKHYNHTYLERGVCVKRTCNTFIRNTLETDEDIEGILGACMNDTIWRQYRLQATLSQLYYCDKHDEEVKIDTLDRIVALIFLLIFLLNFAGTTYDIVVKMVTSNEIENKPGFKLITCFSIRKNWNWLVNVEQVEGRMKNLKIVHGIRSFTNIFTILGHSMCIMASGFTDQPHNFEKSYEMPHYQIIYNGMMIVQTFFVMSGFLLVYHLKIQAEKFKLGLMIIPKVLLMRWWRLTPALAVILAFSATWMRHLGSGPLWKLWVTNSVATDCRTYWWYHLLNINNYVAEDKFCIIQTWHIAADTQLFVIGLLVYFVTQQRGRRFMLSVLLIMGILFPAFHVWWWDMDGVFIMVPEFYRTMLSENFHYLHVYGHNNLVCFVMGMATGELVYEMQLKKIDLSKNKAISAALYLTIPGIIVTMYCGNVFYADSERASLALRLLYGGTHRLVMGIIVGLGLVATVLGAKIWYSRVFEWRGWVLPSRLSYCMFLVNFNLIYYYMGTRTQLGPISFFYLMICHIAFVVLSFIFALPFYLMVEAPMNRLLMTIMSMEKPNQVNTKCFNISKEDHQD